MKIGTRVLWNASGVPPQKVSGTIIRQLSEEDLSRGILATYRLRLDQKPIGSKWPPNKLCCIALEYELEVIK